MKENLEAFLNDPRAQKLLFFNEMLTPSLVRLAYWLCLLSVFWVGLGHMFSGGFANFLEGIVRIVIGVILSRIAAELIMVLFKINENITTVAENTAPAQPVAVKKVTKKASKKVSKKS